MPNWCEGVMKIRGKYDDVERFVLNQIVKVKKMDSEGWYDVIGLGWIKGVRRGRVTQDYIHIKERPKGCAIIAFNYAEAWSIHVDEWLKISKKYHVDVKGFFVERGMEFTQEILIENGKIIVNDELHYDDWEWDCLFPNLGG